ncbi:DMT family transporter [Quadrisphaera sp. DSM 44207]|uniref:DMT family transporter n=1 Tax=Quadrisphaera sp. DSM 44207 TaxID=1881057 RepID=UPI001C40A203|nr:DMT family transporter [Quadrisphaera sp. DSM 44207]
MTAPPAPPRSAPPLGAALGLLAVTAVWGSTFFMLKETVQRLPVADFLGVRFVVATAAVTLFAPRALARLTPSERRWGLGLGVVYGLAQLLQTEGLRTTSASVSGFLTGMYVVLTPLLAALLLRARIGRTTWLAVALATVGLGVLSLRGFAVGGGEALTVASAVLYALHLIGLGRVSTARSALGLTIVQLWAVAAVCLLGALPGGVALPSTGYDLAVLLYTALLAGAAALAVQTWAQSHLPAERAAVIMTMEPVWAGAFAVLLGGEALGARVVVGGALVLAAMYVVELGPRQRAVHDAAEEVGATARVGQV